MALVPPVLLLFSFSLCLYISTAQQNQSHIISLGSSLSPNTGLMSWPSPSGHFAFGFYPQGNGFAIGIWLLTEPENIVVWTANRNDPPFSSNATLELTKAGKLLVRSENGEENLISDLPESEPVNSASMLDSGNFVIYGTNSTIVWQSFDYPTNTLLGGQNLSTNNQLVSSMFNSDHSSGRFFLTMQEDGNLVAYPVNSSHESDDAYWAFRFITFPSPSINLSLDYKGILYLNNDSSVKILANRSYSTEKKLVIYRATLDVDGIFRLYSHNFENNITSTMSTEWEAFKDQCDVKGFCSFNSYCSSLGGKGDCYCYPGFVSTGNSHKLLGCFQNLTEDACRRDLKIHYNMTYMENTWWADYPYTLLEPIAKEDCKRSCQEDCNCGAVLYASEKCHKYKLPLRYGRRNINMSFAAYFKVILGSSESYSNPEIIIKSKENLILILALSLGFLALFCFVLAVSSFLMYRYQVHSYTKLSENGNVGFSEEFALRSFSYRELEEATNGFKEELGRGSFGAVYRGTLQGGNKTIAVKRLEKVVEEGEREFQAEMTAIARTHHRNLVQLLGFCVEDTKKLLVYEYMKNGSLADILFKEDIIRPIWRDRVRIALDIARGIFYLHEECEVRIIHCNIKPQNILIDDSWTAKISDFGLAKLLAPNQTRTEDEGVSESGGYLAPEWQKNSLISLKVDIYSFGVVLLEIICCRRNIEINVSIEDEIILSNWVYNCFLAGELNKLVEDEDVDLKTLERMVKVGLWCTQDDPIMRPSMKDVILMLEGTMYVPVLPSPAF